MEPFLEELDQDGDVRYPFGVTSSETKTLAIAC